MTIDIQRWYKRCLRQLEIDSEKDSVKAEAACDMLCLFAENPSWLRRCIQESDWWAYQLFHLDEDGIQPFRAPKVKYGDRLDVGFLDFFKHLNYPHSVVPHRFGYLQGVETTLDDPLDDEDIEAAQQPIVVDDFQFGLTDYELYHMRSAHRIVETQDEALPLLIPSEQNGQLDWKVWLQKQLVRDLSTGKAFSADHYFLALKEAIEDDLMKHDNDRALSNLSLGENNDASIPLERREALYELTGGSTKPIQKKQFKAFHKNVLPLIQARLCL